MMKRYPWAWLGRGPLGVIAREGRAAGLEEADLVYGETLPGTAFDLLQALRVGPRDTVVDLGCDLVQGFFVGRPGRLFPSVNW